MIWWFNLSAFLLTKRHLDDRWLGLNCFLNFRGAWPTYAPDWGLRGISRCLWIKKRSYNLWFSNSSLLFHADTCKMKRRLLWCLTFTSTVPSESQHQKKANKGHTSFFIKHGQMSQCAPASIKSSQTEILNRGNKHEGEKSTGGTMGRQTTCAKASVAKSMCPALLAGRVFLWLRVFTSGQEWHVYRCKQKKNK